MPWGAVALLFGLASFGGCSLSPSTAPSGVHASVEWRISNESGGRGLLASGDQDAWQPAALGRVLSFGFSQRTVWARLQLRNERPDAVNLVVGSGSTWIDYVDFFRVEADRLVQIGALGDRRPFALLGAPHRFPIVRMRLEPKESVRLLISFRSTGAIYFPIEVSLAEVFDANSALDYGLHGLFFGILFALVVFCGSLFAVSRNVMFAAYVLYLVAASYSFATLNGLLHEFVFSNGGYALNQGLLCAGVWGMIFGVSFSRHFLELKRAVPRLDRAITGLAALLVPAALFCLLPGTYALAVRVINVLVPTLLVIMVALGIVAARLKLPQARLFLLGWSAVLLGGLYEMAATSALLPVTLLSAHGYQSGVLFEAVVFSFALGQRQRALSLEKTAASGRLAQLGSEILLARSFHGDLLKEPPRMPGLAIDVSYRPQAALGGDFYAFERVGDSSVIVFTADVAGHGLGAAMDAAAVRIAFRSAVARSHRPQEILELVNRMLIGYVDFRFVAGCCVLLDLKAQSGIASVGGHPAPVLLAGEGGRVLSVMGSLLGFRYGNGFGEVAFPFSPGSRLLIFTDGLFESVSQEQSEAGEAAVLSNALPRKAGAAHGNESLLERMRVYRKDPSQGDDITLISLEHTGEENA